jgi:hypothetical protein
VLLQRPKLHLSMFCSKSEMVRPWFVACQEPDFWTHAKIRHMHHCALRLCWRIMILQWNKQAMCNVVFNYHLIFRTLGTWLFETSLVFVKYQPLGKGTGK